MKSKTVLPIFAACLILFSACSNNATPPTTSTTAPTTIPKTTPVTSAPPTTTAANSSTVYTISGTVSYTGSQKSGRVYIGVADSNGRDTGIGLSIASPQSYTIHSVPNGTYTLTAWMDSVTPQTGFPNALSPAGQLTVTINNGNISGQTIPITDPTPLPSPVAPANLVASPGNGAVLVQWNAPRDQYGDTLAQYYNIYYSTSSAVTPLSGIKKTIPVNNHLFVSGLADGTTYYFIVTAVLGGVESTPSSTVAATVGATKGSNTVSGAISFPVTAAGPLYVGISNPSGNFFQRIDNPVSPQTYSISGVPTGTYIVYSFIDTDKDGVIDTGDLSQTVNNPDGGSTLISVSGDTTENQALLGTNSLSRVTTIHYGTSSGSSDLYSLEFEISENVKLPVNVTLVSGPNIAVPVNLSGNYYFHLFENVNTKPKAGDSYVIDVSYSDGTIDEIKVAVTGVLDGYARNLTTSGSNRAEPTFNWGPPASPLSDYTYIIQVGQSGSGLLWTYPQTGVGMPSTQTSIAYNSDNNASLTDLVKGTVYDWVIYILDSNGNQSVYQTTYTP